MAFDWCRAAPAVARQKASYGGQGAIGNNGPCGATHSRGPISFGDSPRKRREPFDTAQDRGHPMGDDVKDAIEKNALGPRSARGNVGEVRQHSLKDQIQVDRYLASREACTRPNSALR